MQPEPDAQGVDERRQSVRETQAGQVRVLIDSCQLLGDIENLSRTDVKFYSDEGLAVTVEIEQDGMLKRLPGHVVRLESGQDRGSGWVIEFD
ncbi:MAG: hypothetical protein ACI8QZ_003113 [Chlamydiales bacterium]|jgi:hypothetical protein